MMKNLKLIQKIILGGSSLLILFALALVPRNVQAVGFTCCEQEKADCIVGGVMVGEDKYYNGPNKCPEDNTPPSIG